MMLGEFHMHELFLFPLSYISNPRYCSVCRDFVQAHKKFDFWRLPNILVVHLKRFRYQGQWKDKLNTNVIFPIEGLDLSHLQLCPTEGKDLPPIYDLVAISV